MSDALTRHWKDKYTPEELVEHINISMDDLMFCLLDWIEEHTEDFQEDYENIFGYGELNDSDT